MVWACFDISVNAQSCYFHSPFEYRCTCKENTVVEIRNVLTSDIGSKLPQPPTQDETVVNCRLGDSSVCVCAFEKEREEKKRVICAQPRQRDNILGQKMSCSVSRTAILRFLKSQSALLQLLCAHMMQTQAAVLFVPLCPDSHNTHINTLLHTDMVLANTDKSMHN